MDFESHGGTQTHLAPIFLQPSCGGREVARLCLEAGSMYHSNTTALLSYWRTLRGEAIAPARRDLDLAMIKEVLTQVFMLGRMAPGEFHIRMAGGVVCDAHKLNLRGHAFASLWSEDDRLQVKIAMESMIRTGEPIVINCAADAGPYASSLEILLAPMTSNTGEVDRVFGFFQPLLPLSVLHDRPIDQLTVSRITNGLFETPELPKLRLAAVSGRLIG